MDISLRNATADDLHAMYRLDRQCFSAAFRFSFSTMSDYLHHPDTTSFIAETPEMLAGFVTIQFGDAEAYVITLDVEPALRRSGVAGLLMQKAESAARQRDIDRMTLHVWEANRAAIEFYESRGYIVVDRVMGYYGATKDALVYRKMLTQD